MADEEKRELVLEADLDRETLIEFLTKGEIVAKWELMDDMNMVLSIKTNLTINREQLEALLGEETDNTQGIDWGA